MNSPVFNAGAEGLSLAVNVYRADDADSDWGPVVDGGISVTEIADGNYFVTGLPTASGAERYFVIPYAVAEPNVGIAGASYQYGAVPGVSVVYRVQTSIPESAREFRQGDTFGSIALVVDSGLPEAIGDGDTAVTWSQSAKDSDEVLVARPASITNVVEDAATGTWGATFTYPLEENSLAELGLHFGLFVITYPDGSLQTLPSSNTLTFNVLPTIAEPES